MKYFYIMLFAAAVICSLFATGSFVFWAYLVGIGKPALSILIFAGSLGLLAMGLFLMWAVFLNRHGYQ